jgi:hypothetical protein
MTLKLAEVQALNDLAKVLYSFLPGTNNPWADPRISFAGIAQELGLANFWSGGSKLPAISTLLTGT